jgi:hypothetical protein
MHRLILAVFSLSAAASAQVIIDPSRLSPTLKQAVEHPERNPPLKCEVTPIRPMLNFGFRFQAGYVARVPLKQYRGPGHAWAIVSKITPEESPDQPVYLVTTATLPDIPKTNQHAESGGGYLLGEGRYMVEWTLFDDAKRVCHKNWNIKVALNAGERKVRTAMPPNRIGEISLRGSDYAKPPQADVRPVRITVLLHAAPLFPRRTKFRTSDMLMLLGSLSSLLERLPSSSVRLVVFNMDQQKELFRQDGFALDSLDKVAQAMNRLELGLVDYQVLQNRHGPVEFLVSLANRELAAKDASEIVLFLGPPSRFTDKVPQSALEARRSAPYFFHFQFEPWLRRGGGNFPDTISQAIGKLKGKTIIVHSPGEFAKAIEQLESFVATK